MYWRYERLDENFKMQYCPANDYDGSLTGHIVINVRAWLDENPEEAKRLGWKKHLYYESNEEFRKDYPNYNPATQYMIRSTEPVDEYTIKEAYHFIDKTERMAELEEMLESMNLYVPQGYVQLDAQGGVLV